MKAETIVRFRDLKAGKIREIGEQFHVSKERYKELEKRRLVKEVREEPQETEEQQETAAE